MKCTGRTVSTLTSWILAVAMTVSPVMAQNAVQPAADESASTTVDGTSDHTEATSVLPAPPVASNSTRLTIPKIPLPSRLAVPLSRNNSSSTSAPGESKWAILAALIATGVVVGVILLWPHGGNSDNKPSGPEGTILAPGTPAVGPR